MHTTGTKQRLTELDAIRGLAALAVLLFHYTTYYEHLYGHRGSGLPSFALGCHAVNLFFMVSGYVIYMTIAKTKCPLDLSSLAFRDSILGIGVP